MELIPLFNAVMEVAPPLVAGIGPAGSRSVGALVAATLTGPRLRATLANPAAGDFVVRNGAIATVDVRLAVRTDDGAVIYVIYGGRIDLSNPAAGVFAYIAPTFETGDPRYAWLNAVQAVGKGRVASTPEGGVRLDYEVCEVR